MSFEPIEMTISKWHSGVSVVYTELWVVGRWKLKADKLLRWICDSCVIFRIYEFRSFRGRFSLGVEIVIVRGLTILVPPVACYHLIRHQSDVASPTSPTVRQSRHGHATVTPTVTSPRSILPKSEIKTAEIGDRGLILPYGVERTLWRGISNEHWRGISDVTGGGERWWWKRDRWRWWTCTQSTPNLHSVYIESSLNLQSIVLIFPYYCYSFTVYEA